MENLKIDSVLIENEKDQLIFNYLLESIGKSGIEYILNKKFSGKTKPYISNIVKYGKIEIPADVLKKREVLLGEDRKKYLDELKKKIKKR